MVRADREEQESYCRRFVLPVIAELPVRTLTRAHIQSIIDQARTKSVGDHLRRCVSAMVTAGLEEGLLLARQDVLRGVHWNGTDRVAHLDDEDEWERSGRAVEAADIPTAGAVHALATAAAERRDVWWRELELLLVAYSGMRWGEHAALTAVRVDVRRRRITIDRQVIETRNGLKLGPPKNRRRRVTMFPSNTPLSIDLSAMVERRIGELPAGGLLFPSPKGQWARRSNYRRNLFDPAATAAVWPRRSDGRWRWTFHSLRHVFATWALAQPGARIEDVSRLLGHSTVRVTKTSTSRPTATSTTASTPPPREDVGESAQIHDLGPARSAERRAGCRPVAACCDGDTSTTRHFVAGRDLTWRSTPVMFHR